MPREVELFGLFMPTLLPLLIVMAALQWLIDIVLARQGWLQQVWHPALFRMSLFVCLFGAAALLIYR